MVAIMYGKDGAIRVEHITTGTVEAVMYVNECLLIKPPSCTLGSDPTDYPITCLVRRFFLTGRGKRALRPSSGGTPDACSLTAHEIERICREGLAPLQAEVESEGCRCMTNQRRPNRHNLALKPATYPATALQGWRAPKTYLHSAAKSNEGSG